MIETTQLPKVISSPELVYQDHLRRIYLKVAEFEGFTKQYLVSNSGERAAVLVTCGSYILLVRQYRLLINDISLEIPGGKVDDGETTEKTAIRECQEETGVECRNLKYLLNYYPGLDVTDNPTFIFYSNDPIQTSITRTERSLWLPLDICLEMIFTGKIQDAMTIIALLTYSIRFRIEWIRKEMSISEINPVCARARMHTEFKSI
jgi:ADP-ribose pyrophosphatase